MILQINFSFLSRLVKVLFIRGIALTAALAAVRLLFVFVNPKRLTKKCWVHIGGHKTASTTLQIDIFPHHPEICSISSIEESLKQPEHWSRTKASYLILALYLHLRILRLAKASYLRLASHLRLRIFLHLLLDRATWINPSHSSRRPIKPTALSTARIFDARNKICLASNETLSICMLGTNGLRLKELPRILRANTGILYVTRNEETHLQSMWLAYLTETITGRTNGLPYMSADDFAKLARLDIGSDIAAAGRKVMVPVSAFFNVYNPKKLLQEAAPLWGAETVVLPYELLQKDPEAFLDKMSRSMGISADITISLFKKSIRKKGMMDIGHYLNVEFRGRRNVAMTERGLTFCRAFKHPRAEYNEDRQFFLKTGRNYAENLPGPVNERFLACLANIEKGWSGDSATAIAKLAEDKPFQDWVRKGDRVKPQFSAKTLAELRRIRAPQNRWMAENFNLDLAKYGYAM